MKRIALFLLLCTLPALSRADTLRICTYNVLKYSQANEDGRTAKFKAIMQDIRPDVVVCQEVEEGSLGPRWISDVLRHAPFASTPFIDGPDTDHMLFYNQKKLELVGQRRITTELRDIAEFTLVTLRKKNHVSDTLVVYSAHLKADESSASVAQRGREISAMMKTATRKRFAVVCGDLNLYGPTEPAYVALTADSSRRTFVDPLGGVWKRNDKNFAYIYTQCTRKTQLGACGGGVSGGLDDRFDFVFLTKELHARMVKNTYTVFGNDGKPRLNDAIDVPANTKVSAQMAEALKCASDHLPVYVDIVLQSTRRKP